MTKEIRVEAIKKKEFYDTSPFLTKEEVKCAIEHVVDFVRLNMKYLGTKFPTPAAKNQIYGVVENVE